MLGTEEQAILSENEALVNKILVDAGNENPQLKELDQSNLQRTIRDSLAEIAKYEKAARVPNLPKTSEEASRIKVIWDLSGPGTYDLPFKEDRYKDKPWAKFMDRRRLNYSAWLMRKIVEIRTGKQFDGTKDLEALRQAIKKYSPNLVYNGTPEENRTIEDVLNRNHVIVPQDKILVIASQLNQRNQVRTVEQMKSFHLPVGIEIDEGDAIAVVTHAPHMLRVMHMAEQFKPFPPQAEIKLFPIPSPKEGLQEFSEMEARGLLYYQYISHEAASESHPYSL